MTARERDSAAILIVDSENAVRAALRQSLTLLDFGNITDASDHLSALQKFEERRYSHVIFEAKRSGIPPRDFLLQLLKLDHSVIAIPTSYEPTVDDVFDLLMAGARGYLVKPFNTETVDDAIVMSTKGEPISESILCAENRNEALASLVMNTLNKLAMIIRQAETFETARMELPRRHIIFRRAMEIARTFAQNGETGLLDAMIELADRKDTRSARTRLGRIRHMLDQRKADEHNSDDESFDMQFKPADQ